MKKRVCSKFRIIVCAGVFMIFIGLMGKAEAQYAGQGWWAFPQYGAQGWNLPYQPYQGYPYSGRYNYTGYGQAYSGFPIGFGGSGYYNGNYGLGNFTMPVVLEDGTMMDWEWGPTYPTVEEPYYGYPCGYTTPPDDINALYAGYRPPPGVDYVQYRGESLTDYLYRIGRSDLPPDRSEASEE